jgi:O-antigen/teichoic acid export membrane protein
MSKPIARSIVKNTSIMMGQYAITSLSTFFLVLFLPRYLGPIEYGRLFLATSIIGIFRVLVEYGGNYLVAKKVSRNPELTGQIIVDALSFRTVLGVFAFAGAYALSFLAKYPPEERLLILIVGLGLLWKGAMTVLVASYQGRETMQYTSIGAVSEAVFMCIVGIGALLMGAKAKEIAIISISSSFINFCTLALFSKRLTSFFPKINWDEMTSQIKEGVPYLLLAIFGTIYYRIDSVMLSKMAPESVVGWYGGAYRLFDVLNFFPVIFTTAAFPVLSRLWGREEQAHKRTTQRSLEFMILIGILVTIGAMTFSDKAVQLFYGLPAYTPSIIVLKVLATGIIFLFVDMILGSTLIASNKQRQQSILALIAIPLNVGLNLLLIPYFQLSAENGGIGAGIATVITEFFIMIAGLWLMPKGILKGFRFHVVLKGIIAGVILAILLWVFTMLSIPWLILAILCPFLYGAILIFIRTFEPSEKEFFLSLLKFRNLRSIITGKSNS